MYKKLLNHYIFILENLLQSCYDNQQSNENASTQRNIELDDPGDGLGPLPPKWETAYTERGELYFIE